MHVSLSLTSPLCILVQPIQSNDKNQNKNKRSYDQMLQADEHPIGTSQPIKNEMVKKRKLEEKTILSSESDSASSTIFQTVIGAKKTEKVNWLLDNGDQYIGDVVDGKFHGKGILIHVFGSLYNG